MRYLFDTGLAGALTNGVSLLRGMRGNPFTWRTALAGLSWGITVALAIGAINDMRQADAQDTTQHNDTPRTRTR